MTEEAARQDEQPRPENEREAIAAGNVRQADILLAKKREVLCGQGTFERILPVSYEQEYMHAIVNNAMRAIIVDNDYGYKAWDDILIRGITYHPNGMDSYKEVYSGDWILATVSHVLNEHYHIKGGVVSLSIKVLTSGVADNWKQFKVITEHLINDRA